MVVFAAASESPVTDSADNRPFVGSVFLSKSDELPTAPPAAPPNADSCRELVEEDVHWLPWFQVRVNRNAPERK
jgi:hypothetical protein